MRRPHQFTGEDTAVCKGCGIAMRWEYVDEFEDAQACSRRWVRRQGKRASKLLRKPVPPYIRS